MSLDIDLVDKNGEVVWSGNVTHNLGRMARQVPWLYQAVWMPDEHDMEADNVLEAVSNGLAHLLENPYTYKKFEPETGWGTYEGFCKFLLDYAIALGNNKDCEIIVCR